MCRSTYATVHMWNAEVNSVELVLSFRFHWGLGIKFSSPDFHGKCLDHWNLELSSTEGLCVKSLS